MFYTINGYGRNNLGFSCNPKNTTVETSNNKLCLLVGNTRN